MQGLRDAQDTAPPALRPWRLYLGLLAPSLVVVCTVALLAITSVKVLAAVRAYVGGESLWSKARHEAVQHLLDYAHTRDPARYARYEQALAVPLGDRQARLEMSKARADMALIRAGFIQGGNHPDDIDGMVAVFRRLGDQPLFSDAVAAWIEGDALIARLRDTARLLRTQVARGAPEQELAPTLATLRDINEQLTAIEKRFSASLAEAARVTESLLVGAIVLSAALLSVLSIGVTRRLLARQGAHQQALQAANERWQLAAAASEVGLFEVDIARDIIHMDGRASALYGLGQQGVSMPRASVRKMIDPQDRDGLRQGMNDSLDHGAPLKTRHLTHGADGITRLLETTGRLDHGSPQAGRRLVGVVRDVTAEQARNDLAAQRDAAEQVAAAQRAFLSRLSHELRTPLNAILGFAQLLRLDTAGTLTGSQSQQVQWILTAGQQLLALVEDVLDLTKVEAGEIHMALQPVELAPALRASLALLEGVATRHEVSFVDQLPATALWVRADPQRLQQVFMNLLSNGCKYNRPGGHVAIAARREGEEVVIDITDNGIGMAPQDAAQLFQPFKRVASTPHPIEGTGLGLYIVRQLLERMHGRIEVDSAPGEGSRFTVRLPQADALVSPDCRPRANPEP